MNITLDDTSSQFEWISADDSWLIDHRGKDPLTGQYFLGTFHGTSTDGDAMILKFRGEAVYIYGAFRDNHGLYSAQLDGGNIMYQLSYSKTPQLQELLFSQQGLDPDLEHTLRLVNLPSQTSPPGNATLQWWLDIDYAVITVPTGGAKVQTTVLDDTSPLISYSGSWATAPPLRPELYYNTTAHQSNKPGDSFSLRFNGSSVSVEGFLYVDHGNYTVSLDGQAQGNYNGTWFELASSTLYLAAGLEDGPHELMVTNLGQGRSGHFFDLDRIVINSTKSNPVNTSANENPPAPDHGSSVNIGAMIGGIIGGIALILFGLGAWYMWSHRTRRGDYARSGQVDLAEEEVKPYAPESSPTGHDSSRMYSGVFPSSRAPTEDSLPALSNIPPPPASNATSYPHSIDPPSSVASPHVERSGSVNPFAGGSHDSSSPGYLRTTFATQVRGVSSAGSETRSSVSGETAPTAKSLGTVLPLTAHPARSSGAAIDVFSSRLQRDGRDIDAGPMSTLEEGNIRLTLPPDYQQATQPLPGQQS